MTKTTNSFICFGIAILLVASTMFRRSGRGLKRKANGELRGSRQQMLRELKPDWYLDARTRRSLKNLLALDDESSGWSNSVWMDLSSERGRHYLCTKCGNGGAHVVSIDSGGGGFYRCVDCGGRGVVVQGGVSTGLGSWPSLERCG